MQTLTERGDYKSAEVVIMAGLAEKEGGGANSNDSKRCVVVFTHAYFMSPPPTFNPHKYEFFFQKNYTSAKISECQSW
jgi:hypothetical protein